MARFDTFVHELKWDFCFNFLWGIKKSEIFLFWIITLLFHSILLSCPVLFLFCLSLCAFEWRWLLLKVICLCLKVDTILKWICSVDLHTKFYSRGPEFTFPTAGKMHVYSRIRVWRKLHEAMYTTCQQGYINSVVER